MPEKKKNNDIIKYQEKSGAIELRKDAKKETIWATQAEIAKLYHIDRSVVTKHIRNILKNKELDEDSVCAKFAHTASDGKTYEVQFYNLDIILAVGYRTNSPRAIKFRKWSTQVLREHITKGYTINPRVVKDNFDEFRKAVENVKHLLPDDSKIRKADLVELVSSFASTWLSLQAYDEDELATKGATRKSVKLTGEKLSQALADFKSELLSKKQATDIFGRERASGSVAGIVGNIMQTYAGQQAYPSVEEKAAHLLYFIVKNHPFVDGNKRSGAFAFIWFLQKAGFSHPGLTPEALTAVTLLVAESNPRNKDRMIRLILQLLKQ